MHPAKALHTAARRYCVLRRARLNRRAKLEWWRTPIAAISGALQHYDAPWHWMDGAFRRLQHEIEAWRPGDGATLDATRERLLVTAAALNPTASAEPAVAAAGADERDRFRRYVERFPAERLGAVEPLGTIRRLSPTKSRRVQERLAERWGAAPGDRYWYPLDEARVPDPLLALQSEYFYLEVPPATLQAALYRRGVAALWVVNEFWRRGKNPNRELDTDRFDPAELMFGGIETYACSKEDDWLIYVSHEHSITFAGAWLVDAIDQIWPDWSRRRYVDYRYTGAMHADPALLADPSPLWFLQPDDGIWP